MKMPLGRSLFFFFVDGCRFELSALWDFWLTQDECRVEWIIWDERDWLDNIFLNLS